ncbi:MAG: oxidoreductase [Prochloraceae cyanobacterium]
MDRIRFATVWLSGCVGCHMSFLDMDEWLVELADRVDLVFSQAIADAKEYPENVDICLVEGAIGTEEDVHLIKQVRQRTKNLIALGSCAINSNFTGMRNVYDSPEEVLDTSYKELADLNPRLPYDTSGELPKLLDRAIGLSDAVEVDLTIPGCPPSADRIKAAIEPLLEGKELVKQD